MSVTGFVMPVLAIGLGSLYIKPQRGFYPSADSGSTEAIVAHTTLEEVHRDDLEISEHPIEQGASIADHAFKRPAEVIIKCAWSNSPKPTTSGIVGAALGIVGVKAPAVGAVLAAGQTLSAIGGLVAGNSNDGVKAIYQQLLELQEQRIPFDVYTGKRAYRNMLLKSLSVTTDKESENSLLVTAQCRQIMIVSTSTVQAPAAASYQKIPTKTSSIMFAGQKQLQAISSAAVNPELSIRP
jgi:hypothetical protein